MRMRILRLYAPSLIGDHTLCYVHTNVAGESCVNEVPMAINFAFAGGSPAGEAEEKAMTIVLPAGTNINDGHFIAVGEGETLLRWDQARKSFAVITPGFLSVSAPVQVWHPLRTAVLTVSDKGSRGEREDTAGPELENLISALGGIVEDRKIVPDEAEVIADTVKDWCDNGFNLVLTTGGTGLSPRDVTPEALQSIAEKVVPGFGEIMRARTLIHTERAFLTRSISIIRKGTLVIAFPGSQRGARQCFEAIAAGLRHGVETLAGWDGECGGH
ncbi:MAG: MogA/MoaB family molybdenum cofactor biosynthesis protein [Synergistaceae bacterium]|nr:MogA/MoaB family molybdenum cofactor biosynthesis protein [Synergistaceae bacterium]